MGPDPGPQRSDPGLDPIPTSDPGPRPESRSPLWDPDSGSGSAQSRGGGGTSGPLPILVVLVEVLVRVIDLLVSHPAVGRERRGSKSGRSKTTRPRQAKPTTRLRPTDRRPNAPDLNPTAHS